LEQDFFSALRSQKFNVILSAQACKYEIDGKRVLAFFVPSSLHKPIYYNNPTNTFIRFGSGDQRATNSEITAMFREQTFGIRSELAIPDTHIGLLNPDSLHGYRNYLNSFNLLASYASADDKTFCEKTGITDDKGLLTYGGLLMFGRTEVIHRHVPTFWMDLVEIPGNSVQEAKTRYTYRIPEQENLWEYYQVMIRRLRLLVDTPFKMNNLGVAVDDDSQLMVLREALINMLMHADHFSTLHSCIRIYSNRVEFFNAGSFPVPIERLGKGIFSNPRNPSIAKFFRLAKLAETVGFGIDKLKSWKELTGNDVSFEGTIEHVCLTFGLERFDQLVDEPQNVTVNAPDVTVNAPDVTVNAPDVTVNAPDVTVNIPERLLQIIELMKENNQITIIELSNKLKVTVRTINRDITQLKDFCTMLPKTLRTLSKK
jgi:ATP-dependent DNA helicase RecG